METTPETALKIIRTWAAVQIDFPMQKVLDPESVIRLCDKVLKPTTGNDGAGHG